VRLTADLARIAAGAYAEGLRSCRRETAASLRLAGLVALLPLLPLLPLVTATVFLHEQLFARHHERGLGASRPRRRGRASGPFGPAAAASPVT
jgi:hypothetical protein